MRRFLKIPPEAMASFARELGFPLHEALLMQGVAARYHEWESEVDEARGTQTAPPAPFPADDLREIRRWNGLIEQRAPSPIRLPLCFRKLDAMIDPLAGGEILTFAAATGTGKTTFAMNLTHRLTEAGQRVELVATEMGEREVLGYLQAFDNRFIPDSVITQRYLRACDGTLTEAEVKARLAASFEWLHRRESDRPMAPLHVQRGIQRSSHLHRLFAEAEADRRDVVVIDHLQHWDHDLPARGQFDAERRTMWEIKALAEQHDLAVVLIAQINLTRFRSSDPMRRFQPPEEEHVFGGQGLAMVSTAMLTAYRPQRETTEEGDAITPRYVRQWINGGRDPSLLFKPNTMGIYLAKLRYAADVPHRRAELYYWRGYLFDEAPDFRRWREDSPAALRARADERGDAWEPDGIARENDDGKATP